ncbi:MAG: mitochondrial fission ELM1 family protein [Sulfurovum sp.]|nr:mitochondrial fission ELM1 family protein [Sulfurovum sp.]
MSRVLILSDGKPGHLQQSVAFAELIDMPYDIVEVRPRFWGSKALALLSDRIDAVVPWWFRMESVPQQKYDFVVGTGSSTYYMVKYAAKKYHAKSVTTMLPRGYRYTYDLILAQAHDAPPSHPNIKTLPVNLSHTRPQGIFTSQKPAVGIVIGGENQMYAMREGSMRAYLDEIVSRYGNTHTIAVTTSPRTPPQIEALVASYGFDYEVLYSKDKRNPISDFLAVCEIVFLTSDSTSMISQAVSYGSSFVVVLPLETRKEGKHQRFIERLEQEGYLHLFDGSIKHHNRKIDLAKMLQKVIA